MYSQTKVHDASPQQLRGCSSQVQSLLEATALSCLLLLLLPLFLLPQHGVAWLLTHAEYMCMPDFRSVHGCMYHAG